MEAICLHLAGEDRQVKAYLVGLLLIVVSGVDSMERSVRGRRDLEK